MSGSTYGNIFRITTWGESHGAGVGVVVDGCPAGLPLTEADIQLFLDRIHHQCLRLLHRAGLCKGIQLFSQDNQDRLDP